MLGAREHTASDLGLDADALAPWLAEIGPLAVLDFETTGLVEDAAAEPIEFGALLLDPGRAAVTTLERSFRPFGPVPRSVRALTGIADADLLHAPRIEDVAGAIAAALAGRTLVAHNAAFERHFLARYVAPSLRGARYLDTTELLALAHPDSPDLRLETAAERLLGLRGAHRALADALAAARLVSLAAAGARAGAPRYAIVRSALERYAPRSPWLGLLRGAALPEAEREPAQYIAIPESREQPVPFDADAIAAALADEARGRRHFPGYRVREGQIRMAREFVRVLDEGGRLLLEGGTGVGKSLAYLAALIPFAMERAAGGVREPLLVSTRTKLLQDQLLAKDIPAAAALLGHRGLRALSIKGRANYVCLRRCQQVLAEGRESQLFEEDRAAFAALACAARLRPHGEIGTLPGALLGLYPPLRDLRQRAVASRAEQCTREQCAAERDCPFGRRRKALADAHLVVANHDLLLRWPPDYPAYTCAIVDEAHELAGVADEVYAAEVRPDALLERVDELFGTGSGRRAPPPRVAVADASELRSWRADLQADLTALGGMFGERAGEFGGLELPALAARVFPQAAQTANLAAQRLDLLAHSAELALEQQGDETEGAEAVTRAAGELREAATSLRAAFSEEGREEVVAAFENLAPPFDRWRLALRQVAPALSFHQTFLQKLESFAAVSASLFVGGDAFAALGELEIERYSERPVWSLRVESPFPYERHMRVVALDAPGDLVEETAGVVEDLARLLGGRTLALFTSLRRMRDVRERLADRLRGEGFDLLMPRRATDDPAALVDRFARAAGGALLLGSRTFWQGLDIPGPALSAVVIEKLPFEVPTELRRRREARLRAEGDDAFERHALGKMLLNLKQMVGRLIRSEEDRGLVVIVEPRSDRPYFERLGEALPRGCSVRVATRVELAALLDEVGVPRAGGPS